MSFETKKLSVVKKKSLEKSSFNVECNITNEVEVEKVLSVCCSAQVETVEILDGSINYSGEISLTIIFATIDGEIGSTNIACPFSSKFEESSIALGDKAFIKVEVEDFSLESVSGSSIKINCMCVQSSTLICNREVETVTTADENICLLEDEISLNCLVGEEKHSFVVESEGTIKEPIKKLLCFDSQVSVKNVESSENYVSVAGDVVTRILYLTEKDRYDTSYLIEPFKEEISLQGLNENGVVEVQACVKKISIKNEMTQDDKGATIKFEVPVVLQVMAFAEKKELIIKDVYSICNELEVSTESFEMTNCSKTEFFETKIDGMLSIDESRPRVDKIMFIGGSNFFVSNSYVKNEELSVEGVVKTNVVYLNDETSSLQTAIVEVPFVINEKIKNACNSTNVSVDIVLEDVDVVVKKGREFYFDAKLKVKAEFDCDCMDAIISHIGISTEIPERECAIELVFASQGDTAWDIAKNMKVKETTILLQNPELSFPLEADENIIVFYQKQS